MLTRILHDRRTVLIGTVVCAVVLFVSINLLAQQHLKRAQLDLTADRLYSISEGTRQTLAAIDEPIELRFYASAELQRLGPWYASQARRVGELLDRYVQLSNGMLRVERFDPRRYSPEEDLATADGIPPLTVTEDGAPYYLGLAGSNATDDLRSIPVFSPDRAPFLEYDLTRLVYALGRPEKAVVAVIGDLPLRGDRFNPGQPWQVTQAMESFFNVRMLGGRVERIADDVDVLLLAQPERLDEATLYAIDQFALRGGRILAFADPLPEVRRAGLNPMQLGEIGKAPEVLAPLFAAWGIEVPAGDIVGDLAAAVRVRANDGGRETVLDYPPWLGLRGEQLAADDVVTGALSRLNLQSAGHIRPLEAEAILFEPLLVSSDQASLLERDRLLFDRAPTRLVSEFEPSGERYVLAARLRGTLRSAFPDGPPESVENEEIRAAHRSESEAPFAAVVVADADLLADATWVQSQALFGQRVAVPIADNGEFAVAALDNLTGGEGLVGLRGRAVTDRPFEVIREMRRTAENRYRAKEQELLQRIDDVEERIRELRRQEQEAGVILTAAQQQTIDEFRQEVIGLRAELRGVRHDLAQDVDRLESRITLLNVGAVPALVVVLALLLAGWRRLRARQ